MKTVSDLALSWIQKVCPGQLTGVNMASVYQVPVPHVFFVRNTVLREYKRSFKKAIVRNRILLNGQNAIPPMLSAKGQLFVKLVQVHCLKRH